MLNVTPVEVDDGLSGCDTREKIVLIDADTLAFNACLEMEVMEECLPEHFYNAQEWKEITQNPTYHYDEKYGIHAIYTIDYEELLEAAVSRTQNIISATNTLSAELYFTSGRNFRFDVSDSYKANRIGSRYPTGLKWLKEKINSLYEGLICTEWEADDHVVYLKKSEPDKYVLAAIDKDVLQSVQGEHFDYYYNRFEFVETDIHMATGWNYHQCLIGDQTDGIAGLKGVGKVRAGKALADCILPLDYWDVVVDLYKSKGLTEEDAITTMRLVGMHQLKKNEIGTLQIELWGPPKE